MHKKSHAFFFILTILIGLSSCNLPDAGTGLGATINDVTVTPSTSGSYNLSLRYHRNFDVPVTISCYYVSPEGMTMGITSITDDGKSSPDQQRSIDFPVIKKEGQPVPGHYVVTCEDENQTSSKSDSFDIADENAPTADINIVDVRITPPSGTDLFGIEVYVMIYIPDEVWFTCNYVTPDGATMGIFNFSKTATIGQSGPYSATKIFPVKPVEGAAKPGTYTATCQDDEGISTKSTTFTVVGSPTPTLTLNQPNPTTYRGRITFDYANAQSTLGAGYGGLLEEITKDCLPDVNIDPVGVISGTCELSGETPQLLDGSFTAKINGQTGAAQGSIFNFTYNVISKGSNGWELKPGETPGARVWSTEAIWQINYTSVSGNFTSANEASGIANFVYSCDSGAENLIWCFHSTSQSFSGTIPWQFIPSP
jgi:hypothetical protein